MGQGGKILLWEIIYMILTQDSNFLLGTCRVNCSTPTFYYLQHEVHSLMEGEMSVLLLLEA